MLTQRERYRGFLDHFLYSFNDCSSIISSETNDHLWCDCFTLLQQLCSFTFDNSWNSSLSKSTSVACFIFSILATLLSIFKTKSFKSLYRNEMVSLASLSGTILEISLLVCKCKLQTTTSFQLVGPIKII